MTCLGAAIGKGFIPNFNSFFEPAASLQPHFDAITNESARDFWSKLIVSKQQDVMIGAAATAVGINMTFLFPYSLLRKGWTKEFRSLAVFDLAFGMFIPFVIATTCVVIASASCFHGQVTSDFGDGPTVVPNNDVIKDFENLEKSRNDHATKFDADQSNSIKMGTIAESERRLAAMLVDRKANHLSNSLADLAGERIANLIFGVGVLAMTFSTIIMLMLISGFTLTELLGAKPGGWVHRIGTLDFRFRWSVRTIYLDRCQSLFGCAYICFWIYVVAFRLHYILFVDEPEICTRECLARVPGQIDLECTHVYRRFRCNDWLDIHDLEKNELLWDHCCRCFSDIGDRCTFCPRQTLH